MASSAEIMRAPYRPVPLLPTADLRNAEIAEDNADDADDEDEDDGTLDERSALAPMLSMLEPHLPQLGIFLYTKCVEFFRQVTPGTMSPAATSSPAPTTPATVSTAPRIVVQPMDVAAGFGVESQAFEPVVIQDAATSEPEDGAATVEVACVPTAEQLAHLIAVRERLSPPEQTLVEHVVKRMPTELLVHYLSTLSAMSLDDATTFIRSLIAQARPERSATPQ